MAKKRGNPNWGKPDPSDTPVGPTPFEEVVKKLRLSPADYEVSVQLKEWARKNKDQKYIPRRPSYYLGFRSEGGLLDSLGRDD